mmetsp:Transcript_387/g.564  ORF Transcript_387/g.564 Transcript_387/m.564 type:complete len:100 (-) Transcript_387:99-398(-)
MYMDPASPERMNAEVTRASCANANDQIVCRTLAEIHQSPIFFVRVQLSSWLTTKTPSHVNITPGGNRKMRQATGDVDGCKSGYPTHYSQGPNLPQMAKA